MADYPARPPTPQAMVHRLPDKPDLDALTSTKPSQFIILIAASTAVAGKVQVAKAVSEALGCPLYQGDSMHKTAARAASMGVSKQVVTATATSPINGNLPPASTLGPNETRYQRMWLSKMTRTGLLFPQESRAAGTSFSGFGGRTSPSGSRRGSSSSDMSVWSAPEDDSKSVSSVASSIQLHAPEKQKQGWVNRPTPVARGGGQGNPQQALLTLTHPLLHGWHKECIRKAVGEYGVGVIFVPLDEGEGPVLQPLNPTTMTSFGALGSQAERDWRKEVVLAVDVDAKVEALVEDIVHGVRDIMDS